MSECSIRRPKLPRCRRAAAGLLAYAAALIVVSPAVADVDTYVPGGLTVASAPTSPVHGSSKTGMSTATAIGSPSGYTILSCNTPYIPVSSTPSGYVIGNCLQGVHLYPQAMSNADGATYYGGWIFGNYNGCGWIAGKFALTQTQGTVLCPSDSIGYNLGEFASATNASAAAYGNDCNPKSNGGPCTDGSSTYLSKACTYWANFRPWVPNQGPTDLMSSSLPAGTIVKWRYVAKYISSSGNYYVMIKLANSYNIQRGYGNWGFVNANCLAGLPYYTPV